MCAHKTEVSSKTVMALTRQEISANFYRRRKENGLCPRCGKPLDRNGHYCSKCLEKTNASQRDTKEFYRKNGLCTSCGKVMVLGSEKQCPECRVKRKAYRKPLSEEQKEKYNKNFKKQQRNLYQKRKEQGICTRCGKRKAMPGKAKCGICLEKDAEAHRKRYFDKPNIWEERIKNHLCLWCGEPAAENGKLCTSCLQRSIENGRKSLAKNKLWKDDNKIAFMEYFLQQENK